jgi:hypothetical protein
MGGLVRKRTARYHDEAGVAHDVRLQLWNESSTAMPAHAAADVAKAVDADTVLVAVWLLSTLLDAAVHFAAVEHMTHAAAAVAAAVAAASPTIQVVFLQTCTTLRC